MAVATQPDISYAVNSLSQFNNSYNEDHWQAAKRVLRYIKGTIDNHLKFVKTKEKLKDMPAPIGEISQWIENRILDMYLLLEELPYLGKLKSNRPLLFQLLKQNI